MRGEGLFEEEQDTAALCVKAAREQVETETRRAYMKQTWVLKLRRWWGGRFLELPRPPLLSVTSITYVDTAEATQTLATSVYKVLTRRHDSPFGGVYLADGEEWPELFGEINAQEITITFVAGYSSNADEETQRAAVPATARVANRQLASHYFGLAREVGITGTILTQIPHGLERILWGLKVPVLDYEREAA
jgi:uncharacterized phiE125 gp8 family phage protein